MSYATTNTRLADCREHGAGSGAELFVVEGESASRAVESVRDAHLQAVLPMQGKPLNAVKASRKTVAANALFAALVEAMGTGWDDAFDLSAARYDRVVLLTDPDADGIHCGVLLLMFFHRWMRPWLDDGRLLAVQAPMFEIVPATGAPIRAYTEEEYREQLEELGRSGAGIESKIRHRGLGSIDPGTLRTCCVVPETRRAFRLRAEDAVAAMDVFAPGMGGKAPGGSEGSGSRKLAGAKNSLRDGRSAKADAQQLPLFGEAGKAPRRGSGGQNESS